MLFLFMAEKSFAHTLCKFRRIAIAGDLDLGEGIIHVLNFSLSQLHLRCTQILFQAMHFGGGCYGIFALDGRERQGGMRPANRLHARFGKPPVSDLARFDQFSDRSGDLLDGHLGIDPMLVEQIDMVRPEPFQRRIGDFTNSLRPAVLRLVRVAVLKAEFCGDHHLITDG